MGKFIDRTGQTNINKNGSRMTIIEYKNAFDMIVEFENGYKRKTTYKEFKLGTIRNPYDKTLCGIGYLGCGNSLTSIDGKATKKYEVWSHMLMRCYSPTVHKTSPTYLGCTVHSDWHDFNVFGEWFDDNFYSIEGELMALDKDILVKGNKMYSKDACCFVPERINSLFIKANKLRSDTPIGVSYYKKNGRYRAYGKDKNGKRKELGYHTTQEEAFQAYKEFKEKVIKEVANEYIDKIPLQLYNAMLAYEVEITD